MKKIVNKGDKIGECIFISYETPYVTSAGKKKDRGVFLCKCGNYFIARIDAVKCGNTNSCGCFRLNRLIEAKLIKYEVGEKINGIIYLGEAINGNGIRTANFLCPFCNKEFLSRISSIKNGHTTSCGCFKINNLRINKTKHGRSGSKEYKTWERMKSRCLYKRHVSYKNYGGRGVPICKRWLNSFENFFIDMGEAPSSKHTLDRINPNKGYSKSNCRWATTKEQGRNRRNTIYLTHKGTKLPLAEWIEISGLNSRTVRQRLASGWTVKKAFENRI